MIVFSYFPEDPRPRRETEALVRNGFEVDLLCLRRSAKEPIWERLRGVSVYRLPLKRRRTRKFTYAFQYASFLVAAFVFLTIRSFRGYGIVHVHNMPDFLVFSALVPRLLGAKVILDLHDPVPELLQVIYKLREDSPAVRTLKLIERRSVRFADAVLTPNIAFKELFVNRGCPADKIRIVMNSPDEAIFNPRAAGNGGKLTGFNVMFHGTLLERNGLGLAIEAIGRLREEIPALKLHIYGEPTAYASEMMQKVQRFNVCAEVEYHGYKPLSEVPAAISGMDMGIVPNPANAFNNLNLPTRIFEYLSMGKLAIAPRTKGIQDYFQEDELLFFEPGNADDLAERIHWAFAHPVEAEKILQRGYRVYGMHRWQNQESGFIRLAKGLSGWVEAPRLVPSTSSIHKFDRAFLASREDHRSTKHKSAVYEQRM